MWVEMMHLGAGCVLIRIGCFVFESFDENVEPRRKERAKHWSDPVNPITSQTLSRLIISTLDLPMVVIEGMEDHTGSKSTSRIEGTTGILDAK